MKKLIPLLLSLISFPVLFCSCIFDEYNPTRYAIASESEIIKEVNRFYGSYGTFKATDCETEYIKEKSFRNKVEKKYWNNVASRKVTFNFTSTDGTTTFTCTARDEVYYGSDSEFYTDSFYETYVSDFYGYYYCDQADQYYKTLIDKTFDDTKYPKKLIRQDQETPQEFSIGSSYSVKINSLEKYLANADTRNYYVAIQADSSDTTTEILMNSFRYQLKISDLDCETVYYLAFNSSANFDSLRTYTDIVDLDENCLSNNCYTLDYAYRYAASKVEGADSED